MKFTKMHGIGNDYIYVNGFEEHIEDPSKAAVILSDRHTGIGSDGLILINPSQVADFEMEMYNADGSRGKMCGNGIRCVAKYVYDHGMTDGRTTITVETLGGIKTLEITVKDGKAVRVRVDMGAPIFTPEEIPVLVCRTGDAKTASYPKEKEVEGIGRMVKNRYMTLPDGTQMRGTCVSMGNPHCVVEVEDVASFEVEKIGRMFETLDIFPDRINTEFIHVDDRKNVTMRVWERGSGETMACGTGACAVAASCIVNGLTDDQVTIHLLGGDLEIEWDREKNTIFMTGPAAMVFEGEVEI